ncbi:hypothetical protein EUX98_g9176 [Antrodiella citrinella]|uniref:Uncharacterized protein n=1 Tax=Antrodiella citrinella TaxID=2447956 RepID=A0A4S4LX46_9APHY|nr:hypothetical protein EUX98_g9176 [Antrodiella citrinella]
MPAPAIAVPRADPTPNEVAIDIALARDAALGQDVKSLKALCSVNKVVGIAAQRVLFRDLITCLTMWGGISAFLDFLRAVDTKKGRRPRSWVQHLTIRGSYGPPKRSYVDEGMHIATIPTVLIFDLIRLLPNLTAITFEQCIIEGPYPETRSVLGMVRRLSKVSISNTEISAKGLKRLLAFWTITDVEMEAVSVDGVPNLDPGKWKRVQLGRSHLCVPGAPGYRMVQEWQPFVGWISDAVQPTTLTSLSMACDLRKEVEVDELCDCLELKGKHLEHLSLDYSQTALCYANRRNKESLTSLTIRLVAQGFDVKRVLPEDTTLGTFDFFTWERWTEALCMLGQLEHIVFKLDAQEFDLCDLAPPLEPGSALSWMNRLEVLLRDVSEYGGSVKEFGGGVETIGWMPE